MLKSEFMEYINIMLCQDNEELKKDTLYTQLKNEWIKYITDSNNQE